MQNLLRTGIKRRIFRKMTKRHSYYDKNISCSRHLLQETGIARDSV